MFDFSFFLFGFQIYFDFSGYSFIALGSARMLGIIFPNNFNFPYIASSPKVFGFMMAHFIIQLDKRLSLFAFK